jgi:putative hydrolase of the HAD superfamily
MLDADGVCSIPSEPFSRVYARRIGVPPESFESFFKGPFQEALLGRADLSTLIQEHHDLWQWDGPFDQLLSDWCETENVPNRELLGIIKQLRQSKIPVYLATNQEAHRTNYLKSTMFKDVFDAIIASYEVGFVKSQPGYWSAAISRVRETHPDILTSSIVYFDDNERDVEAAARAGISAYAFEWAEQVRSIFGLTAGR